MAWRRRTQSLVCNPLISGNQIHALLQSAAINGKEWCSQKRVEASSISDGGTGQSSSAFAKHLLGLSKFISQGSVNDPKEVETLIGNALDEVQRRRLDLACHPLCSRALESLLAHASVVQVSSFFLHCNMEFVRLAMDASGSHVAEAAIRSLDRALSEQCEVAYGYDMIEDALIQICKDVGDNALDIMCNRYGSHVLRSLLSLLSGTTVETSLKPSHIKLVGYLSGASNCGAAIPTSRYIQKKHHGYPEMLTALVNKILETSKGNIHMLKSHPSAGPVLQVILRVLQDGSKVTQAICIYLECDHRKCEVEGQILEEARFEDVEELMKHCSGSHLMEAILECASDLLYMELFQRFFIGRLLHLSMHKHSTFIVQSLIASARSDIQVNMIFEELKQCFPELVEKRASGIIASLLAACDRFHVHKREVCRAVVHAFNPDLASSFNLVPRLLYLEDYTPVREGQLAWKPPFGSKMSVLGCVMLQIILSYPQVYSQPFYISFARMDALEVLQTAKDPGGSLALEAFLNSCAPDKLKHLTIEKLKGNFAELALHAFSYHTVDRCYEAADYGLRDSIVLELSIAAADLSRRKHGSYILNKCSVGRAKQILEEGESEKHIPTSCQLGNTPSPEDVAVSSEQNLDKREDQLDKREEHLNFLLEAGAARLQPLLDDAATLLGRAERKPKRAGNVK